MFANDNDAELGSAALNVPSLPSSSPPVRAFTLHWVDRSIMDDVCTPLLLLPLFLFFCSFLLFAQKK